MVLIVVCTVVVSIFIIVSSVSLIMRYKLKLKQYTGTESMKGKTVLITGATAGIGRETAIDLARRGARLILACRNLALAETVAQDMKRETNNGDILAKRLDLASLSSIREFCDDINQRVRHIHVLINNAGVFYDSGKSRTEDGFDMIFGVNHLGHFLLTNLLLEKLKTSAPSRLVVVGSAGHAFGKIEFDKLVDTDKKQSLRYGDSKLANALFTREFARRMKGTGVTSYCLHPGVIKTDIGRDVRARIPMIFRVFTDIIANVVLESPIKGAQTTIYCAVAEELSNKSGHYYVNCHQKEYAALAYDDGVARKLWEASEKLVGL